MVVRKPAVPSISSPVYVGQTFSGISVATGLAVESIM